MDYDVIVAGGSFAGLSAALQIARARRRVLVIDAGEPRNRFSPAMHGLLGQDGRAPAEMLAEARAQLAAYPEAELRHGLAEQADGENGNFAIRLETGEVFRARRLVLATGIVDELPDVPGLSRLWGRSVLHCPYCHGYEIAGERIGVLATGPASSELANLATDWGQVVLFTQGEVQEEEPLRKCLSAGGRFERAGIASVDGVSGGLAATTTDGRRIELDALFIAPDFRLAGSLASQLGCRFVEGRHGRVVETDDGKQTSVNGLYAAGDMASFHHNASVAIAAGATAGIAAHQSLVE
jgi:thioredoxin reductase